MHHEQLLQLDGDLHHRRQHDQEGALLLAGDELGERGLDHLGVVQEAVEVVQEQQGGAVALGQGGQGTQGGQRVAGGRRRRRRRRASPGKRRPSATSQTASFQSLLAGRLAISRSASSGSLVWIHRPLKAAWT